MMTLRGTVPGSGTPRDLLDAAALGARIAARYGRAGGLDDEAVRRKVITRYRRILQGHHDDYESERLMVAVERAIEQALAESPRRLDYGDQPGPGWIEAWT